MKDARICATRGSCRGYLEKAGKTATDQRFLQNSAHHGRRPCGKISLGAPVCGLRRADPWSWWTHPFTGNRRNRRQNRRKPDNNISGAWRPGRHGPSVAGSHTSRWRFAVSGGGPTVCRPGSDAIAGAKGRTAGEDICSCQRRRREVHGENYYRRPADWVEGKPGGRSHWQSIRATTGGSAPREYDDRRYWGNVDAGGRK